MEIKLLIVICIGLLLSLFLFVAALRKPIELIALLFLLRPISFYDAGVQLGPFTFFEFFSIYMNFFILVALMFQMLSGNLRVRLNGLDMLILAFTGYTLFLLVLYPGGSVKAFSLYFLPLFNFQIICKMLDDPRDATLLIRCLLWGYILPIILTFYSILTGSSLAIVSYWTGQERYRGIYQNVHTMGHSMLLYLMLFHLHLDNLRFNKIKPNKLATAFLGFMGLIALYCQFKSVVRTTFVGLVIFIAAYYGLRNKKILAGIIFIGILGVVVNLSYFDKAFNDVTESVEGKQNMEMAGSGRLYMWKHNIAEIEERGAVAWVLGTGLGSTLGGKNYKNEPWQSHNDYLDIYMNAGIVGALLYIAMLLTCWFKAFFLPRQYRAPFVALVSAVIVVNVFSNCYISRFPLAQIFWMLMSVMYTIDREHKDSTQPEAIAHNPWENLV